MKLKYNDIEMETTGMEVLRSAVYDDATGLHKIYDKWTISVDGFVHLSGINYSSDPSPEPPEPRRDKFGNIIPGGVIQQVRRQVPASPVKTDAVIREKLLTPRKQLLIWDISDLTRLNAAGGVEYLLVSPGLDQNRQTLPCDVGGGPLPVALQIKSVVGAPTLFVINFQIETFTSPEPYTDTESDQLLLSNQYRISHLLDQTYTCTREVEGVAVFRADAMEKLKLNPDAYRANLMLPIPRGFRRERIQVGIGGHEHVVNYSFVDVQKHSHLKDYGTGAAYFEASISEALVRDRDLFEGFAQMYRSLYDFRTAKKFAKGEDDEGGPNLAALANVAAAAAAAKP